MKQSMITLAAAVLMLSACTAAPTSAEQATPEVSVPQVCLDALADAEALDDHMLDALDASGRAMEAAVVWDAEAIEDETDYIESITPEVQGLRASYATAAEECRGE